MHSKHAYAVTQTTEKNLTYTTCATRTGFSFKPMEFRSISLLLGVVKAFEKRQGHFKFL